jgi:hypothetical protein
MTYVRAHGVTQPPLCATFVRGGWRCPSSTAKLEPGTISLDLPNRGYAMETSPCMDRWRSTPLGWVLAPRTADYLDCEIEAATSQAIGLLKELSKDR